MTDLHGLFAAMTAATEDLHGISVEGQDRGSSVDMLSVLAGQAQDGIRALCVIAVAIQTMLADRSR